MLPGATRFVGLPPWVRIVPDGRGGEAVLWPHPHGAGDGDGSEGDGEEEGYWGGPHVYDDVGHPGSFLGGGGPSGGRRSTGLVRGEGAIHRGDSSSSGVWGEEGGQLGIGMTQARQREIQGAVVSMMGGGGGGSSTSRVGRPPSPFARGGGGGGRNGRDERGGDAEVAAAAAAQEWACELCTLINAGRRRRCEACGSAKPPVPRSPRANNNSDHGGGGARSPLPPRLLSPVPPPGVVGEGGGAGEGPGQGQQVPPEGAVLAGPDAGGEDAKEDETEEAKAGDPDV